MQPPPPPPPIHVVGISDGVFQDQDQSKYFGKPVAFLPRWRARGPDTYTPPLLLRVHNREGEEDTLSEILNRSDMFSKLSEDVLHKIQSDVQTRETHELCMRFLEETEYIINFNRILWEFMNKIDAGRLKLDYIHPGYTSYVLAFVEYRCIVMAKKTYRMRDPNNLHHLQYLRENMLMFFAIRRRNENNAKLLKLLTIQDHDEEGFIDDINLSIERTAKLCCTVLDTDFTVDENGEESKSRGGFPNDVALALLNDCCDQFLTIINTPTLRVDSKQKALHHLKQMMSWLYATARDDNPADPFDKSIQKFYQDMKGKILTSNSEFVGEFAGGGRRNQKINRIVRFVIVVHQKERVI